MAGSRHRLRGGIVAAAGGLLVLLALLLPDLAEAQRRQRASPVPEAIEPKEAPAKAKPAAQSDEGPPAPQLPAETVQADVSARNIAVTATFSGVEIVVFGAVDNSRQPSAESGIYNVVVVIEGAPVPMIARRKSKVWGLWLNTSSATFEAVPSFYAISSTLPLEEVASEDILKHYEIGFAHTRMVLSRAAGAGPSAPELRQFRDAVVRIKRRENLYVTEEYGVAFIGRSLFRASIDLPANVSVGPFETRVYLFRDGQMLSRYTARLNLEREGLERLIHGFALQRPWFYGFATVLIAVGAGLLASTLFSRARH